MRAVTFSTSAAAGLRTISFQADDNATPGTPDGNVASKQVSVASSGGGAGALFANLSGGLLGGSSVAISRPFASTSNVGGAFGRDAQTLLLTESLASNSVMSAVAVDRALTGNDGIESDHDLSSTTQTDLLSGEERDVALLALLNQGFGF